MQALGGLDNLVVGKFRDESSCQILDVCVAAHGLCKLAQLEMTSDSSCTTFQQPKHMPY